MQAASAGYSVQRTATILKRHGRRKHDQHASRPLSHISQSQHALDHVGWKHRAIPSLYSRKKQEMTRHDSYGLPHTHHTACKSGGNPSQKKHIPCNKKGANRANQARGCERASWKGLMVAGCRPQPASTRCWKRSAQARLAHSWSGWRRSGEGLGWKV